MCEQAAIIRDNLSNYPLLKNLMPEDFEYHVCSFELLGVGENFKAHLKLKLSTVEDMHKWQEAFKASSGLTWRKSKTYPDVGLGSNKYRVDLRCQHNTRTTTKTVKNTCCPAFMYLVLKRQNYSQGRKSRSEDVHLKEGYCFNVILNNAHNHRIICAAAFGKRDVSKETENKLKKLFESGHSPASALDTIKYDLQEQEGSNYWFVAADRSVCPDRDYCYYLYNKLFKEAYGAKGGEDMLQDLQCRLDQFNQEQGEVCSKMARTWEGQLIVAICTPMMKRVHGQVHQSGEMLFIDSTGNCDRLNHRVFLLLTHCSAGGLPLGVLVTTSESQHTISAALELLTNILPQEAFFGRQEKGPRVIMTDDCLALRNSLRALYPDSTYVLCIFHLAQAMWRWLWSSHHGVSKGDRPQLMRSFQGLIYAESPASLENRYLALTEDPVAKGHPQFLRHLAEVYGRREEWAICLQSGLPTRGHHTNNFAEGGMRVLKDKVLHRLKAYNVTQLVDFVHTRLEAHYIRRLTDVANNRVRGQREGSTRAIDCGEIVREDAMSFSVSSSTGVDRYLVSMDIGFCSCPEGVSGHCCKHQVAVERQFQLEKSFPHTSTSSQRKLYHAIASGGVDFPEDWFQSLELSHSDLSQGPVVAVGCAGASAMTDNEEERSEPHSLAGPSTHEEPKEHLRELAKELNLWVEGLQNKMIQDETYQGAVMAFLKSASKLSTDTALQSALYNFGNSKQTKSRPRGFLQSTTNIGVQPTAVARRKSHLGGRRTLGSGGRLRKGDRKDHPYQRQGRPKSVPHSLAHCVQENTSLGKSH